MLISVLQTEIPISNLGSIINSAQTLYCEDLDVAPLSINIVEMVSNGFVGVYNPDCISMEQLLVANSKGNFSGNVTDGLEYQNTRRRLLATAPINSTFSGIRNPTSCVEYGNSMFFSVSNDLYPVYDV